MTAATQDMISTCMVAGMSASSSSDSTGSTDSTNTTDTSSATDEWDCPPPPSPPAPATPPPREAGPGVCLATLSPSADAMKCGAQAGMAQIVSSDAVLTTLLHLPPATANCSLDGGQVVMSFPCYQAVIKSMGSISAMVGSGSSSVAQATCPSTAYVCNCLATIATKCPLMAQKLITLPPPSPTAPPNCVASSMLPATGLSASCTALNTMMSSGIPSFFATACPANVVNKAPVVLTTAAATTASVMTPFTLSTTCSALLGMPVATANPTSIVAAAVTLSGYTKDTFTPVLQLGFETATARVLNVAPADVNVTGVTNAPAGSGRRLSTVGVVVAFTVAAPSTASATTLSSSISALSTTNAATFASALQTGGMTQVTSASITMTTAPITAAHPPPPPPSPRPPPPVSTRT
jgi:hypothetical protein